MFQLNINIGAAFIKVNKIYSLELDNAEAFYQYFLFSFILFVRRFFTIAFANLILLAEWLRKLSYARNGLFGQRLLLITVLFFFHC